MTLDVYTIGHSTQPLDRFLGLLAAHGITALADVRSSPYSRMNPQFNRESLRRALHENGISYVFLGKELGARSSDPACYAHGRVQYELLARTETFMAGLKRVEQGAMKYRVALMCAEKDPLHCHRTILVARHLVDRGAKVHHILNDGAIEKHEDALRRLAMTLGLRSDDMFSSKADIEAQAYRMQGQAIAYEDPEAGERRDDTRLAR